MICKIHDLFCFLVEKLKFISLAVWAVVQLVGVVVWAGWRVEREVGVGTARAGEGGFSQK